MAVNTFKQTKPKATAPKKSRNFFRLIESYVKLDVIFENGLPVKYIPYILFTTGIGIFYIGNTHYAEKMVRKLDKLKVEVDDLRSEYTTLKAEYMYEGMQSEVAKKVSPMGLYESSEPPYKIVVKEEE